MEITRAYIGTIRVLLLSYTQAVTSSSEDTCDIHMLHGTEFNGFDTSLWISTQICVETVKLS